MVTVYNNVNNILSNDGNFNLSGNEINININIYKNFRIHQISNNTTINLYSNNVSTSGFIVITNVTPSSSFADIAFNWIKSNNISDTTPVKLLNIMTNSTLNNSISVPSGNYIFKYYIVNDNVILLWDIALIQDGVDGSLLETTGSTTINDSNIHYIKTNTNLLIPDDVNSFTAYMWGAGENSNIGSYTQSTITLPKMSSGTDVLNISIGTQNSAIKYEGKLLLNSSSSGHNIVGNVNGTFLTALEANVDNIETSFIGTNIKLYGSSNAIETFSYSYGPDKFISNYDDFNSISDYNENRFDPYNECFYQYTRSFNFDSYDNLLNNSANYYYYTQYDSSDTTEQYGSSGSNGIVVIKFNYPQERVEGIYSTVSSVSPIANSKVSVNYVGHSPSYTSKVLLVKEYLGNIDYYDKPLSSFNGTIDFDSSSFSTAEIAQSTFHAVLTDDSFKILYGNVVGQPSDPSPLTYDNEIGSNTAITISTTFNVVSNPTFFVIKDLRDTDGFKNAFYKFDLSVTPITSFDITIVSARYDLYFFNGSWTINKYDVGLSTPTPTPTPTPVPSFEILDVSSIDNTQVATVTDLHMSFDGYNVITLSVEGSNLQHGWVYDFQYSSDNISYTQIASNKIYTSVISFNISNPGFYRAYAGGSSSYTVSSSLNEIIFTPSRTSLQDSLVKPFEYSFDVNTTCKYYMINRTFVSSDLGQSGSYANVDARIQKAISNGWQYFTIADMDNNNPTLQFSGSQFFASYNSNALLYYNLPLNTKRVVVVMNQQNVSLPNVAARVYIIPRNKKPDTSNTINGFTGSTNNVPIISINDWNIATSYAIATSSDVIQVNIDTTVSLDVPSTYLGYELDMYIVEDFSGGQIEVTNVHLYQNINNNPEHNQYVKLLSNSSGFFDNSSGTFTVNDEFTTFNGEILPTNGYCTISFWFKMSSVQTMMLLYSGTVSGLSSLNTHSSNSSIINIRYNSSNIELKFNNGTSYSYPFTPVANTWYHFVLCTYSHKIYIDNSQLTPSATVPTSISFPSSSGISVGSGSNNTEWFYGNIYDFRVYTSSLSDSQISEIYNRSSSPTATPFLRYTFNFSKNDTDSIIPQSVTVDDKSLKNELLPFVVNDNATKLSPLYNGDDSNNSESHFTDYKLHANDTISLWFYILKYKNNGIIRTSEYNNSNTNAWALFYHGHLTAGSRIMKLFLYNSAGSSGLKTTDWPLELDLNTWHHLTYNHASQELYINNSLISSSSTTATSSDLILKGNQHFHIGSPSSVAFYGFIDDIRVYDGNLTSSDVSYIYNNTTDTYPTSASCLLEYHYHVLSKDNVKNSIIDTSTRNTSTLYEGTHSGYFNDSTLNIHSVSYNHIFSTGITFTCWFNKVTNDTWPPILSSSTYNQTSSTKGFAIYLHNSSANDDIWISNGSALSSNDIQNGDKFDIGQWYFIAITLITDQPIKLYKNGVLFHTTDFNLTTSNMDLYDTLLVGKNNYTSSNIDAFIDKIKIYNRVLVNDEISNVYTNFKSTIYSALLEFDGYNQLTITPSGLNLINGWGYALYKDSVLFSSAITTTTTQSFELSSGETGVYKVKLQGTDNSTFVESNEITIPSGYIINTPPTPPPTGYRYIGFYGTTESGGGFLNELQLNYTDGTTQTQPANSDIYLVAGASWSTKETLFNGSLADDNPNYFVFNGNLTNVLLFYIDLGAGVEKSGVSDTSRYFSKQGATSPYNLTMLVAYGTNTPTDSGSWVQLSSITRGSNP